MCFLSIRLLYTDVRLEVLWTPASVRVDIGCRGEHSEEGKNANGTSAQRVGMWEQQTLTVYAQGSVDIEVQAVGGALALSLSPSMSVYLSIYLSVCLSIYLSIYLSIHLSMKALAVVFRRVPEPISNESGCDGGSVTSFPFHRCLGISLPWRNIVAHSWRRLQLKELLQSGEGEAANPKSDAIGNKQEDWQNFSCLTILGSFPC